MHALIIRADQPGRFIADWDTLQRLQSRNEPCRLVLISLLRRQLSYDGLASGEPEEELSAEPFCG
jgi:hypothetical protein